MSAAQLELFPVTEEDRAVDAMTARSDANLISPDGTSLNLINLTRVAYRNAVDHGWYSADDGSPIKRDVSEILINCYGEVREYVAKVNTGKYETYYKPTKNSLTGKPEGAWIELADILIRLADACGHMCPRVWNNVTGQSSLVDYGFVENDTLVYITQLKNFTEFHMNLEMTDARQHMTTAAWIEEQLGVLWEMYRRTPHENFVNGLWDMYVSICSLLCREYHGKIVPAILEKHKYNQSRSFRHGGLRA